MTVIMAPVANRPECVHALNMVFYLSKTLKQKLWAIICTPKNFGRRENGVD
jgi:hypothetical protein